jgi:hypothetical protein
MGMSDSAGASPSRPGALPARQFPLLPALDQGARETIATRSHERSGGRRAAAATGMTRAGGSRVICPGSFVARGGTVAPRSRPTRSGRKPRHDVDPGISSDAHRIRAADPFTPKLQQHEADSRPPRPRSRYPGLKRRAADRGDSPSPMQPICRSPSLHHPTKRGTLVTVYRLCEKEGHSWSENEGHSCLIRWNVRLSACAVVRSRLQHILPSVILVDTHTTRTP